VNAGSERQWVADPRLAWTPTIAARRPAALEAVSLERRLVPLNARLRPGAEANPVWEADDFCALLRQTSRPGRAGPVISGLTREHVVVSVEHAVADGLGLLAALTELTTVPLSSNARGVSDRPSQHGFLAARVRRLAEVVWSPPAVVTATRRASADECDAFASIVIDGRYGTAAVVAATAHACTDELVAPRQTGRVRIAVGLSRVSGVKPRLHDDSALLRLSPRTTASVDTVRLALRTQGIEPSPGDSTYAKRPWLAGATVRLQGALAPRLGSTVLVSHLGTVGEIDDIRFYPVTGGGSGLAVGVVVQGGRTTLAARARGDQHEPDGLRGILEAVAERL
jgi:hypothetical protein